MENQTQLPSCRQCPSNNFRLPYVCKSRYMGICDALHVVLQPLFEGDSPGESHFISRANVQSVQFEPVDNCPHIESLRKEGLLPWALATIDFLGKRR